MDDEAIIEMFEPEGRVTIKRMFGGKGVYVDGVIVALEVDGRLLLKADAATIPAFEAAGSERWVYEDKSGRRSKMPYWTLPDEALDDDEARARWASLAVVAGRRTAKAAPRD